jgi:hypothetical protein
MARRLIVTAGWLAAAVPAVLVGLLAISGPSPTPSTNAVRIFPTRAGTVVGRCAGDPAEIVSVSPAQGYSVHERDED